MGQARSQMALMSQKLWQSASEIRQTASLTYDQFLDSISTLNELAGDFSDINGKHLIFRIRKDTDTTVFWKGTVRIKCHKVNSKTGAIESTRILSLKQYVYLYNEIMRQTSAALELRVDGSADAENTSNLLDASVLLTGIDEQVDESDVECVICMDRKAEIILPCSHMYCEQCFDEWQDVHKTCPMCRATVKSGQDTWVLSEKPDDNEMAHATSGYLMGLVDKHPTADSDDSDSD